MADAPASVITPAGAKAGPDAPVFDWNARHLGGLLLANLALSLGGWLVRLADTGPVAAGFWRLLLALPVLLILARREPAAQRLVRGGALAMVVGAGVFFALDLAAWHVGIELTKLGNSSLFANGGSLIVMVWGLVTARRVPRMLELAAIATALGGAALLMNGSLEISSANLSGDLFSALAGLFYAFYILMLNSVRSKLGQFSVLVWSVCASVPVLLLIAMLRGEAIMPHDWTPLIALAFSSQLVGQGLLIYSLRHFPPLVIGLALLTQPAVAAAMGWLAFGETLTVPDVAGMVLLASALVLARLGGKG